jgi:hypothetical protein
MVVGLREGRGANALKVHLHLNLKDGEGRGANALKVHLHLKLKDGGPVFVRTRSECPQGPLAFEVERWSSKDEE